MARPKNSSKLSPADLVALDNAIFHTELFPTMSAIQGDLGFSWDTIKRRALELNNLGRIEDSHPFLNPSKQRRPKLVGLDARRRQILKDYLVKASRSGRPVSLTGVAAFLNCGKPAARKLIGALLVSDEVRKKTANLVWKKAGGAPKSRRLVLKSKRI